MKEELELLRQINELLKKRVENLEEMLELSMEMNRKLMERLGDRPVTPLPYPLPTTQPMWPTINPPIAIKDHCSKCGLKMEGVMGYVCSQPQCPTGLGGAWCGTKTNT